MFNKNQFIKTTQKIFEDCLLPNGAILGAPSHWNIILKMQKTICMYGQAEMQVCNRWYVTNW